MTTACLRQSTRGCTGARVLAIAVRWAGGSHYDGACDGECPCVTNTDNDRRPGGHPRNPASNARKPRNWYALWTRQDLDILPSELPGEAQSKGLRNGLLRSDATCDELDTPVPAGNEQQLALGKPAVESLNVAANQGREPRYVDDVDAVSEDSHLLSLPDPRALQPVRYNLSGGGAM